MTREAEKSQRLEVQDITDVQDQAPTDEQLTDMARRISPLVRDEEHSFVPVEDTDAEDDPDLLQPNLTGGGNSELRAQEAAMQQEAKGVKLRTKIGRIESEPKTMYNLRESDLERMTDEEIKEAGLLKGGAGLIHPARISPSSERTRTPLQRSPAAGPGTWPVPEGQLPAVMPSDPPIEDSEDVEPGDKTFEAVSGFKVGTSGDLAIKRAKAGTTLTIPKKRVREAAAIYLGIRNQFPHFTQEQIADEFLLRFESGIGESQSHRAADELSQHGLTAVGDDRVSPVMLGNERAKSDEAFEADPEASPASNAPSAGLPSTNEPASTAPDMAKEPSGETAKADAKAIKGAEKFDHDQNGAVGGSKPKGSK